MTAYGYRRKRLAPLVQDAETVEYAEPREEPQYSRAD